ncbi:type IA DNA topoisomerase [Yersinia enterocolitica]|uniref:type IA DNA topoisomerase n=1 Tax=Yersinia enterocolitica TaxID=630 RepID=UPI001C610299|nr:type IA DNA topoisomerase [Yersinia enterocolitica]MBW5840010.1 topoisomerase C-terminal repeat-containing protein [Yersinia enterocolitica]MBW5865994.1 topoisomerase C-terminal repeat-containing protein [Yersinia enterocolitica]
MRLFIAEKPSLARAILEGLGGDPNTEKKNGYFEHNTDVVTWCYGHMLELYDPQDYDPKFAVWRFSDLSEMKTVYPPTYKIKKESEEQTRIILSLIEKADSIVHAGDPDEEGCLLVDEILVFARNKKPVERLLISDLNLVPVQKALANMQVMKSGDKFSGMTNSALARALCDQSFGYKLTRGCTLKGREKGYEGVLNVGRVQSAVLGLINLRTLANQNHAESFYYDIFATLAINEHHVKVKYQTTDSDQVDEKKRLISDTQAQYIAERVLEKEAIVTMAVTKPENTKPPMPLNLSTLQQICAKRYGYKSQETLEIMQGLYETHKLVTYPRTDNRYLSDEHFYQAGDIAAAVSATMPELALAITGMNREQKHKAFNATNMGAHHAIVPTTKSGSGIQLSEKEKNVYRLVAIYYIGLFWPDAIRNKTKVHFDIKGNTFTATQSILVQKGWEALGKDKCDNDESDDSELIDFDLATLEVNDNGLCESTLVDKKPALPPKYFTESTLLAAMTHAAKFIDDPALKKALEAKDEGSEDRGSIGTEATRAGILDKLAANTGLISIEKEKGYSELVWKTTKQGQEFCAALPPEVIKPNISAMWAEKQAQIKSGKLTIEDFIRENDNYISQLIDDLDKNGIHISSNALPCPVCNKGFLRKCKSQNGFFWGCSCYPDCKTSFQDKNGKPVIDKQAAEGVSARLGVPCPSCNNEILIRQKGYFCTGCEFKIWSEFSGKKLTQNQVETVIKKGKSGEIKGFISKVGKKFDAIVVLQDKSTGKLGFEFRKK